MLRTWFRVGMLLLALMIFAVQTNAARAAGEEEKEREVTLKEVPAKVKATILKAAGKNEIKEIEEVILKLFEVEWTKGEKEIEVFIKPDGQVLMKKVEKEDEEEEADEQEEKEEKESAEKEDDGELDEREITIDQLPDKAKATVKKLAGKNKIELEQLRMKFYEVDWMRDGKEVEILVAADGTLVKPKPEKAKKAGAAKAKKKKDKDEDEDDDEDEKEDKD